MNVQSPGGSIRGFLCTLFWAVYRPLQQPEPPRSVFPCYEASRSRVCWLSGNMTGFHKTYSLRQSDAKLSNASVLAKFLGIATAGCTVRFNTLSNATLVHPARCISCISRVAGDSWAIPQSVGRALTSLLSALLSTNSMLLLCIFVQYSC